MTKTESICYTFVRPPVRPKKLSGKHHDCIILVILVSTVATGAGLSVVLTFATYILFCQHSKHAFICCTHTFEVTEGSGTLSTCVPIDTGAREPTRQKSADSNSPQPAVRFRSILGRVSDHLCSSIMRMSNRKQQRPDKSLNTRA